MIGIIIAALTVASADPCVGRGYDCVDHPPSWYDEQVKPAQGAPADGADTGCLERLEAAHIKYTLLTGVAGVSTPIEVTDTSLGLVKYQPSGDSRTRLILDCHTVEVLAASGRALRKAGVATIHWSSSWRYTYLKGTKTLSRHAVGEALDIVAIEGDHGYATVKGHYERGVDGCGQHNKTKPGAALHRLVCALRDKDAFKTVFTPDTDALHADHLHLQGPNPEIRHALRRPPQRWWRRHAILLMVAGLLGLAIVGYAVWRRSRTRAM